MSLFISLKDKFKSVDPALPQSFRQIENWANSGMWTPITYSAGFVDFSGFATAKFFLDPFGFVHVRGQPYYPGALAGGWHVLATLPLFVNPSAGEQRLVVTPSSTTFIIIDVVPANWAPGPFGSQTSPQLCVYYGAALTGASVQLQGSWSIT